MPTIPPSFKLAVERLKEMNGTIIFGNDSTRFAFAELIDRVSGESTWNKNPWVFAYTFKLIE